MAVFVRARAGNLEGFRSLKGVFVMPFRLAAIALMLPIAANAAPPAPGSEDYEQLMPYARWIETQPTNIGGLCCSLSDCRTVKYRIERDHYEAFIALTDDRGFTKFEGAPNGWRAVPEKVVKHVANPSGAAIACWAKWKDTDNGFYCFFPPVEG